MNQEIREILEEICTSLAGMMGTEPINLAGKEMPSKQNKKREHKAHLGYKYKQIRSHYRKMLDEKGEVQ